MFLFDNQTWLPIVNPLRGRDPGGVGMWFLPVIGVTHWRPEVVIGLSDVANEVLDQRSGWAGARGRPQEAHAWMVLLVGQEGGDARCFRHKIVSSELCYN